MLIGQLCFITYYRRVLDVQYRSGCAADDDDVGLAAVPNLVFKLQPSTVRMKHAHFEGYFFTI